MQHCRMNGSAAFFTGCEYCNGFVNSGVMQWRRDSESTEVNYHEEDVLFATADMRQIMRRNKQREKV